MTQQQVTIICFNPELNCVLRYYFPVVISSLEVQCKCSPGALSELPWRPLARSSAADKEKSHKCEENIEFSLKVPGVSCKDLLPEYIRLAL